jgi:hypothetical protein
MWTDFELFVLEMLLFVIELIKSILHKKNFLMIIFRYIYLDIYEDLEIWKFYVYTCLSRILVCRLDKKWTAHHFSQNCTLFIECFVFSIGCSVLWIQICTWLHILYIVLHCVRANIDMIFLNVFGLCIYIYVLCEKKHIQEHEHFTTSSKPSSFCKAFYSITVRFEMWLCDYVMYSV